MLCMHACQRTLRGESWKVGEERDVHWLLGASEIGTAALLPATYSCSLLRHAAAANALLFDPTPHESQHGRTDKISGGRYPRELSHLFAFDGFSTSYLSELQAIKPSRVDPAVAPVRPTGWIAPPASFSKINVDADVGRSGMFGAVAVVSRDPAGVFLGASVIGFPNIGDPTTLEALAVRESLALSKDLNLQHIRVASDCKEVVDKIKRGGAARYGAIVQEIKHDSNVFISCNIVHEFRSSNFEVHNLAKHALSFGAGRPVWLGQPDGLPFVPVNILMND